MGQKLKKGIIILTAIAVIYTVFCFAWKINVSTAPVILELGEELSKNPEDYARGFKWSVNLIKMDFSTVDETKTGEYAIALSHGGDDYEIPLIIEDTTAPKIILKKEKPCFEVGTIKEVSDLVENVEDFDCNVELIAKVGNKVFRKLEYKDKGEWSLLLEAKDSSGNISTETVEFITDTAPELQGIQNFYVAKGYQNVSFLSGVTAYDEKDGDLTGQISIVNENIDFSNQGNYDIEYEITDSNGLQDQETAKLFILEKEELEEKIGDRELNWRNDKIFGADNLYDAGAAVTDQLEEQLQYLMPTEVHLFFLYPDNPNIIDSRASGFIIHMTEETVYLCTNYHVISEGGVGSCYFFDGTKAPLTTVGHNQPLDIAILKVDRAEIQDETFHNLMTVHLNETEYEIAKHGDKAIFLQKLDRFGVDYYKTGKTLSFGEVPFRLLPGTKTLATNLECYHGSSGSAVMDYEGNLISMVSGFEDYEDGRIFHQIGLTDIIEQFEKITGINLYSE